MGTQCVELLELTDQWWPPVPANGRASPDTRLMPSDGSCPRAWNPAPSLEPAIPARISRLPLSARLAEGGGSEGDNFVKKKDLIDGASPDTVLMPTDGSSFNFSSSSLLLVIVLRGGSQ